MKQFSYDVIVIGGGHAGCEAALANAKMGLSTLLVTLDSRKIAEMSCNPSIGGVGKGQLTKEIDALGGEMGRNADYTGIQFKRLNTRKGSAVQSSRCQSDKRQYALRMQGVVSAQPGLTVYEGEVKRLLVESLRIQGILVESAGVGLTEFLARSVVITAGTFMRGLMHTGLETHTGGRHGEKSSVGLSDQLAALGISIRRLKTGTPPRLLRSSIDWSRFEEQYGDEPPRRFSFSRTEITLPQVACYITYTNPVTHEAIRGNLDRSPLYSGRIKGIGPRYCPSIEDKVVKFPQKDRHQLFFEPEALDSDWIYPNGISTSLPSDVQERFVRTIPGCEGVQFARFGYAVEYDCIDPQQLEATLQSKVIEGLFFGGQVNGTSGYEEAAAQGLMAGINAGLRVKGEPPLVLSRSEGYIGVMIDDLISLGVNEPYRMFTSRAEFRLSLREDNADLRLRPHGIRVGLVTEEDKRRFELRKRAIESSRAFFSRTYLKPSAETHEKLAQWNSPPLAAPQSLLQLLRRPELGVDELVQLHPMPEVDHLDADTRETLEVEIKYEGYIALQRQEIERLQRLQNLRIPENMDFLGVSGLSTEIREKLAHCKPQTIADAARISGVTPAALSALAFHLRERKHAAQSKPLH